MVATIYLVIFTLEGETKLTEAANIDNPEQSIAERPRTAVEATAGSHASVATASAHSPFGGYNDDDDDGEAGSTFADYRPVASESSEARVVEASDRSVQPSYVGVPDTSDATPGDYDGKPFDFRLKIHS